MQVQDGMKRRQIASRFLNLIPRPPMGNSISFRAWDRTNLSYLKENRILTPVCLHVAKRRMLKLQVVEVKAEVLVNIARNTIGP